MKIKDWLYQKYLPIRQTNCMRKSRKHNWHNSKIHICFLIQYLPSWGKMDLLYRHLNNLDDFEVSLLCLPEHLNDDKNATYLYLMEKGYEAINAKQEDGSWFPIRDLKPDYIFTTQPYDFYLPLDYQSYKLSKFSKLCNLSYGINLDKELSDYIYGQIFYRYVYMNFVEMESLVDIYQKTQSYGHKKRLNHSACLGMVALDGFMQEANKPSAAWEFSKNQFRVIWTPRWTTDKKMGGSNFFTFKQFIIDYFSNNTDIDLLIRPHPLMFSHFLQTGELTPEEESGFKTIVKNAANMSLDEQAEYAATFWNSNVLISDYSSIVAEYFLTEKPIIFCKKNMELHILDNFKRILDGCYVVEEAEELHKVLEMLKNGDDPLADTRAQIKEELFGQTLGKAMDLITDWLRKDSLGR